MKSLLILLLGLVLGAGGLVAAFLFVPDGSVPERPRRVEPRRPVDTSGVISFRVLPSWRDPTSLEDIRQACLHLGQRNRALVDEQLRGDFPTEADRVEALLNKAAMFMYDGDTQAAYEVLGETRRYVESSPLRSDDWLYTVIFFQGVAGLRRGENENCVDCRGAGACIFPLAPTAVHKLPAGSRTAIRHFTEYLEKFPDDLGVRWLLNLAYMTLGEYPAKVPPQYLLTFDQFGRDDDIGRFRDISHLVGVNRVSISGGAVMDDFDNDGLLDVVLTCFDPAGLPMAFYRNKGDGTFEDVAGRAGLGKQYGGFNLVQGDYNNDGFLDLYVARGTWGHLRQRPSLLRNNGDGTFTDVTQEAGLMDPVSSFTASWADYDNDGHLDLFVCCGRNVNRLYHNRGNGTFEEVAGKAGIQGKDGEECRGAAWLDYDNDGYPDLFLNYGSTTAQLFHNNRDGTFVEVSRELGIGGPWGGFSCWAFDYDNDGWIDIFATGYLHSLDDVIGCVLNLPGHPDKDYTRLFRNLGGKGFKDVSQEMGVAKDFSTMGSNFGDFDNDGFLDVYLGTGDPDYAMLVPNRMFRNVGGQRFAEITTTAGTGHLQKTHGIACGDWDRDGNVDLFVQIGGAAPGDAYHNVLFQNPGHANHWLTLKLVGKKTNRAAIGARVKVVTAGDKPLTVHRHISSGSSFGGNPLQQTIGLGPAGGPVTVEVFWPTSRTTQVFQNVSPDQAIEVTEFAKDYRKLNWTRVPVPKE